MCTRRPAWALTASFAVACLASQEHAVAQSRYQLPPKAVVEILDAKPLPTVAVSPSRQEIVLLDRAPMPSIAELAEPMLRLAGDPHQLEDQWAAALDRADRHHDPTALRRPEAEGRRPRRAPGSTWLGFSDDGRRIAFTETKAAGIALWVADVRTGAATAP